MGLENVTFRQGDVGALPFDDASFDAVLSLNGFHAFPDKEAAYREVFRVLKPRRRVYDLQRVRRRRVRRELGKGRQWDDRL